MSSSAISTSRGQIGPQGPSGYTTHVYDAGTNIGGHRVVYIDETEQVQYASSDVPAHARKVIGITTGAGSISSPINIQANGEIEELSWNWTTDSPIYVGTDGMLTQTAPTSGFCMVVAMPITSTKILITIREPIMLIQEI